MKKLRIILILSLSISLFFTKSVIISAKEEYSEKNNKEELIKPIEERGLDTHHYMIPIEIKTKNSVEKFFIYKIFEMKFFNEVFSIFERKFRTYTSATPLTSGLYENFLNSEKFIQTDKTKLLRKIMPCDDNYNSNGVSVFIEDIGSLKKIKQLLNSKEIKNLFEKFKQNLTKKEIEKIHSKILKELKKENKLKKEKSNSKNIKNKAKNKEIDEILKHHIACVDLSKERIAIKNPDEKMKEVINQNKNNKNFLKNLSDMYEKGIENEYSNFEKNKEKVLSTFENLKLEDILEKIKSAKYKTSLIAKKGYFPYYGEVLCNSAFLNLDIFKVLKYDKEKLKELLEYYKKHLEETEKNIKENDDEKFNKQVKTVLEKAYQNKNILTKNLKENELKKIVKNILDKDIVYNETKELKNKKLYYEIMVEYITKELNS